MLCSFFEVIMRRLVKKRSVGMEEEKNKINK